METPVQRTARLVAALEALVAEETATLRHRDYAGAAAIAERAAPVVEWIAGQAARLTPDLRERLVAVQSSRRANEEFLAREIADTGEALREVARSRRRVARIAPAYGTPIVKRSARLSAVG